MRGGALRCAAMWSAHSGSGEGRKWVHVIVLCSLLALGLCSGTTQPSSPPPMPALSVTPASLAMADCTSAQLSVDARDASGQVSAEPVTFSSTDVGVAAVDSNGLVVATGSGTATVVVSVAALGLSETVSVVVSPAPQLTADPTSLVLSLGQTRQIAHEVLSCRGVSTGQAVSFASANEIVATVSVDGVVTGVGAGSTTIALTTTDASMVSVAILVVAGQPSGILGAHTLITDRPFGIGISSADQVYVTRLDGAVTRGSLPQFLIEGEVAVGSVPRFVVFSPDGSTAFVANEFSSTISRIDVTTHVETGLIPLTGRLFRLAISADGNVLYAAGNADEVFVINAISGALTATIPVDNDPNGMVFSPDGSFLYVSHISGNSVVEIRTGTNTVSRTFDLGQSASQDMTVSVDGTTLYVAMEGGSTDPEDRSSVGTVGRLHRAAGRRGPVRHGHDFVGGPVVRIRRSRDRGHLHR